MLYTLYVVEGERYGGIMKRTVMIILLVVLSAYTLSNAASFTKKEEKYITEKKHQVEMLGEEEKILKSRYTGQKVSAYQAVTDRKTLLREARDKANSKLKAKVDEITKEIEKKNKEKALRKKIIISSKNSIAKAYNAVVNVDIARIDAKIKALKEERNSVKKKISKNNDNYKSCVKELDNIIKTTTTK